MLSAKFKVSFVKLSPGIRRALKDILHDAVTSNLTLITYQKKRKSLVCWKKMKKKERKKINTKNKTKKKCYASFRDMCLFFFFTLLLLVSHLSWHQTASNSVKQTLIQRWCEEGCRYFTKWRYMTKCSLRLTTAEEVSGFLYPHHSLPAHPLLLQTTLGKKKKKKKKKRGSCFE